MNELEAKILEQKDELERHVIMLDELRKEKAQELALKDAEIADQKQKVSDALRLRSRRAPLRRRHWNPPRTISDFLTRSRAPLRWRTWRWSLATC